MSYSEVAVLVNLQYLGGSFIGSINTGPKSEKKRDKEEVRVILQHDNMM